MPPPPSFADWRLLSQERGGPLRLTASADGMVLYRGATDPLAPGAGTLGFASHQVTLSAMHLSSSGLLGALPPPLVSVPRLLPVEVQFDVGWRSGATIAFAIEDFLGETNALDVGVVLDGHAEVTAAFRDFNNYGLPRFVRGNAPPARFVSAIIAQGYLALMDEEPVDPAQVTPRSAPFTTLVEAQGGVVLSLASTPPRDVQALLRERMALFALVKGDIGQPSPANVFPGTLSLIQMADGAVSGSPQRLFAENGTFGFDVDTVDRKALVLGATATGPQLLYLDLASGITTTVPWPSDYPATTVWAASPTMAAVPGGSLVSFAFYEGSGESVRGIRYGQIDLAQFH